MKIDVYFDIDGSKLFPFINLPSSRILCSVTFSSCENNRNVQLIYDFHCRPTGNSFGHLIH